MRLVMGEDVGRPDKNNCMVEMVVKCRILLSSHFQDHVFKKCSENVVSAVVPQISSAIVRHHPEQFQLAKWGSCMCTCISPRMVSSINLIASPADQSETDL